MNIGLSALKNQPRLLLEIALRPLQGTRFQPTGFPDLGAAEYEGPNGSRIVLVESAQSMANRLENVCWDSVYNDWVDPLKGLPYVRVLKDGKPLTNSVLEAHRLNSEYIAREEDFAPIAQMMGFKRNGKKWKAISDSPFDMRRDLAPALLKYDPNSLIHGVFLEEVAGIIRLPRALSAFIEASDVKLATSGGVKFNRVDPTKKEGEGNVPYSRTEYVSERIVAFFNLDLAQLRAFGFSNNAEQLLIALALFKIQRFLESGLRLRTACDLEVDPNASGITIKRPSTGFELPSLTDLEQALPELIVAVSEDGSFADPRVTDISA